MIRKHWLALTAVSVLLAVTLSGCLILNRFYVPPDFDVAPVSGSAAAGRLDAGRLDLMTWNIGYAGMGKEADFVADGGRQRRPASRRLVEKNLEAITGVLETAPADLFLLQEVARPSWNTYRVDVLAAVTEALPGRARLFAADFRTRWMPPPFRVAVGNAIFSRFTIDRAELRGLPLEPAFYAGLFRKGYRMQIARLANPDTGATWVVVNVHLAAFDPQASVRHAQVEEVLGFAVEEYRAGRHVVVGGDWNLRLAETEFPHRTEERHLFWVHDFPDELAPRGWSWGVDPDHPTVRTAHQPYVAGDNYVTIIDGFLCSPNVTIERVETLDLGFETTDHHPVRISVRASG